jgi:hypothetical protein
MGKFLKFIVIVGLFVAGGYFIAKGLGAPLPFVDSAWVKTASVPAGVLLLAAGVAIAYFWKVTESKTITTTVIEETPDGTKTTTTTEESFTTAAAPPPH